MDIFICPLCSKLLVYPVTTNCGHSYCKDCLRKILKSLKKCPGCEKAVAPYQSFSVNVLLQSILEKEYPNEYETRKNEYVSDDIISVEHIPLLMCKDIVYFPGYFGKLDIFELRYKEMISSVLLGNKIFGVLSYVNNRWIGAKVEIKTYREMRLGTFKLDVVALSRFRTKTIENETGEVELKNIAPLTAFQSSCLYYCTPEYYYDEETEVSNEMLEDVERFVSGCIQKLSVREQIMAQEKFKYMTDLSFYSLSVLKIPQEKLIEAFLMTNSQSRLSLVQDSIRGKRVGTHNLRRGHNRYFSEFAVAFLLVFLLFLFDYLDYA